MNMETFKEIRPLLDAGTEAMGRCAEFQIKIFGISAELGKMPDFKSTTVHGQYMELCDFIIARIRETNSMLRRLDSRGGLGHDVHEEIRKAIGETK